MVRESQSMIGISHPSTHLRIIAEARPEGVLVVRVRGEVDADSSRTFDHYLRTRLPAEPANVVLDTSDVTLLSAHGVRTLIEHTERMARQGKRLLIVQSTPLVRRVLEVRQAVPSLHLYDSLLQALNACRGSGKPPAKQGSDATTPSEKPVDQVTALQHELLRLRVSLQSRLVVARASGVVQERYQLATSQRALDIMRNSADRHNVRLSTVANALLGTRAPEGSTWFPGRVRRPAPSLSFVEQRSDRRGNRSAVLGALLHVASDYLRAASAAVYLIEQPADVLRMELSSSNMPTSLANYLTGEEEWAVTPNVATPTTISDVEAQSDLAARDALLSAGIRAMHTTPLLTEENQCVGVVVTYHAERGFAPTRLQCARLDHAATEVATWLDWHHRTVVFDALEQVHADATAIR